MEIILMALAAGVFLWLEQFIYQKYWDKDLEVQLSFQKKKMTEGETNILLEIITNRKRLMLPVLHATFHVERELLFESEENVDVTDYSYKYDVFSILGRQRVTRHLSFYAASRGYYELKEIQLLAKDIFLTQDYVGKYHIMDYLYVYPKASDIRSLDIPFQRIMGELAEKKRVLEDPFAFTGIRDYSPYDAMSKINWKASARTGSYMVNTYDTTVSQEVVIFLNLEEETVWYDHKLLEESIRLCAGFVRALYAQGIGVCMRTNGRDKVTKEELCLNAGQSMVHFEQFLRILSRIDLKQDRKTMVPQIKNEFNERKEKPFYLFISPYQKTDFCQCFSWVLNKGQGALWLSPMFTGNQTSLTERYGSAFIRWEVEP